MSDIYKKICGKKSIHVALTQDSHIALKLECTRRGLSMQEVIENFAYRLEIQDKKFLNFLDEVREEKRDKASKKPLKKSEIRDIYNLLEQDDD